MPGSEDLIDERVGAVGVGGAVLGLGAVDEAQVLQEQQRALTV
jgi:hypothetical protein